MRHARLCSSQQPLPAGLVLALGGTLAPAAAPAPTTMQGTAAVSSSEGRLHLTWAASAVQLEMYLRISRNHYALDHGRSAGAFLQYARLSTRFDIFSSTPSRCAPTSEEGEQAQ